MRTPATSSGRRHLSAGVTTVRDMGGETRYLTAFRDVLENGRGLGPRLLLAGLVDGPGDEGFGATIAATADEARAVVERFRAAGFQQMKLYTLLAPDIVSAITSRAHAAGMTVTGHVPRALTTEQGVERGMDQIAHLPIRGDAHSPENRRLIAALAAHHTVVDPTLSWTELLGRGPDTALEAIEPAAARLPKPLAENYRSVTNANGTAMTRPLEAVKAMHDAGVTLVVAYRRRGAGPQRVARDRVVRAGRADGAGGDRRGDPRAGAGDGDAEGHRHHRGRQAC